MTILLTVAILVLHYTILPALPLWVALVPLLLILAFYVCLFLGMIKLFK
jgi:hypothetical protein